MRKGIGDPSVLDRKTPSSAKYSHVGSSLDTGASAKKHPVVSSASVRQRRDEIFKRIRPATLVRYISERDIDESVYALADSEACDDGATIRSEVSLPASRGPGAVRSVVASSAACSVASAVGSVISVVDTDTTVDQDRDLVLLDLREPDEYEQYHLPLSVSFPSSKINREQFSADLVRCKRDASKLLVVYHNTDALTANFATQLVQKGWETVHALSGGLEEMVESYPEVLEGEVPERPVTGRSVARAKAKAKARA